MYMTQQNWTRVVGFRFVSPHADYAQQAAGGGAPDHHYDHPSQFVYEGPAQYNGYDYHEGRNPHHGQHGGEADYADYGDYQDDSEGRAPHHGGGGGGFYESGGGGGGGGSGEFHDFGNFGFADEGAGRGGQGGGDGGEDVGPPFDFN